MSKDYGIILSSWRDLAKYGIGSLTGEACAYSMRLLCDLNEDGVKLIQDMLGMPVSIRSLSEGSSADAGPFARNMNTRVNDKEAIASTVLFYELLEPICMFILFHIEGCKTVIIHRGQIRGLTGKEEEYERIMEWAEEDRQEYHKWLAEGRKDGHPGEVTIRHNRANPAVSVGGRNIHQMTGRVL